MKVLIAYYSQTGNTEKIARAIYEAAENETRVLEKVDEVDNLETYDMIFLGFPILHHSVPGDVAKLLQRIPESKSVAIFATHGSMRGGKLAVEGFYHAVSLASNLRILGTFGAQGQVNHHAMDKLIRLPEYRGWLEEARSATNHPDKGDIADAMEFAAAMLALANMHR